MKKVIIILSIIINICLLANAQKKPSKSKQINTFISTIHRDGQFSGGLLVVEKGRVIYKKGFGYANRETKELFTTATPCYIGSVSKQFTAMGIMILQERRKLSYDESIRSYFPDLPVCMQKVTILHLLHHSGGLALFGDFPDMNEKDVFDILLKQQSLHFNPGEKFEYCNAGYTLLGMIIEKVSGESLNDFLTKNVFLPVGMKNTYVNSPASHNKKRAVGYYLFGDENNYDTFIGGAASVVSTIDDLYLWDKMLYAPTIISAKTLEKAFERDKLTNPDEMYGVKGYGFGWFVSLKDGKKIIQHDGGFGGFRSYIERQPLSRNSIIFLSNVRHSITGQLREGINNILKGKPYLIPGKSWANKIIEEANTIGMEQAIANFKQNKNNKENNRYYFSESEVNSLGYYLMNHKRLNDAILFFTLNTEENPTSSNAFDSLGEAYMNEGNKESAISNYKKSFQLNPLNDNAKQMIEKLDKE
ncbi:serine hydrolase domain-containing protein [Emticicia sp. BO119]|uniref:serine hydrolase domain-containing protein n=1 Tax=Emticicia sp. BO119 TaxID=2757768 RepID=UPI0015F0108A|nr:serine hydrolase domain-containing protein [Emticicia sp. BO119]MBA4849607.1 class A beta-lactamase-related serine hydrolase [Emticicia sp. BO119]